jgi:hypothetical protein
MAMAPISATGAMLFALSLALTAHVLSAYFVSKRPHTAAYVIIGAVPFHGASLLPVNFPSDAICLRLYLRAVSYVLRNPRRCPVWGCEMGRAVRSGRVRDNGKQAPRERG